MDESRIFADALKLTTPAERAAYLDAACADDVRLRADVEALLRAHAKNPSFLEQPVAPQSGTVEEGPSDEPSPDSSSTEQPGDVLAGRYKLLQPLGEGGMGSVWMARQTEPVKRQVAVKLIKAGMDSKQVLARFEAERQALALMDHPNIARVLDGGITVDGRSFFVMELVKGVPITKYCDEHRLTPKERLELFVPVCQAVQHAHQKGVIHRDIKPSNVLVARYDGKPMPKVIDFGIAKATGQQLTDRTLVTGFGAVVGTLEYMSPEQAELNQFDIDTRSDVYSLGVLLYELLTGTPPLARKRVKEAGILEVLRLIREEEPLRPSTRLSTTEELPAVAANRGLEPKKLRGLVRGDLDWIVMKALEKDRSRRYESPNALAQDIRRYLDDRPVQACPPSAAYRLAKFVRRNRMALTAVGLVLAVVAVGAGVSTWQTIVALQARDAEEKVRGEQARQRKDAKAKLTAALLQAAGLLEKARKAGPADSSKWGDLRDTMQQAEALAGSGLADPEDVERVATLSRDVREEEANREMVARLDEIRQRQRKGPGAEAAAGTRPDAYEAAFRDYGLSVLDLDAEEAARRIGASSIRDWLVAALDDWAGDDRDLCKRLLPAARGAVKDAWRRQYFDARIRHDWRSLIRMARRPETLTQPPATICMLARALGLMPAALELLKEAQRRSPADFWINILLADCGSVDAEERVGYARAALAVRPESLGPHYALVNALRESGHADEALALMRHVIRRFQPDSGGAYHLMAEILDANGDHAAAVLAHQKGREIDHDPGYLELGQAASARGDWDGAVAAYRKLLDANRKANFPYVLLAEALGARGDWDEALAVNRELLKVAPDNPESYLSLGLTLLHARRDALKDDVAAYRKALELCPRLSAAHAALGEALRGQGDLDGAVASYRTALDLDPVNRTALLGLGDVLRVRNDLDGCITVYRTAINHFPGDAVFHHYLAEALRMKGDLDGAVASYRTAIDLLVPGFSCAWLFEYAEALRAKGDLAEAVDAYEVAVDCDPDYVPGTLGLVEALRARGDGVRAVTILHKAFERAITHQRRGDRDLARLWYAEATGWLEKHPDVLEIDRLQADELRRVQGEAEEVLELKK